MSVSLYSDRLSESIKNNRTMTVLGAITRLFLSFRFRFLGLLKRDYILMILKRKRKRLKTRVRKLLFFSTDFNTWNYWI